MAVWAGFAKFLFKDFLFPISDTHVVRDIAVPSQSCESLCIRTRRCCRWGLKEVGAFSEAENARHGLVEFGWEVQGGSAWAKFQRPANLNVGANLADYVPEWCSKDTCANAATAEHLKIDVDVQRKKLYIDHTGLVPGGGGAAVTSRVAVFTDRQVPGKDGAVFYLLLTADREGWKFWDKYGTRIGRHHVAGLLGDLKSVPSRDGAGAAGGAVPSCGDGDVLWVKGYSCALFQKEDTRSATLRALSLYSGLLTRCGGDGGDGSEETLSELTGDGSEEAFSRFTGDGSEEDYSSVFTGFGGEWSIDASAGSPGISFASIVCAVFSAVALVFLVLFAAKRNDQVVVADE